ncbi:MAG: hypothetical protein JEZ12_24515 [Desulfobacterium sp.]|nr:hypothetical protein [Desulfobacterium sp.]
MAAQYNNAIDIARKMVVENKTPTDSDKKVKIDDSRAFKAFEVVQLTIAEHEETAALTMKSTVMTLFTTVLTAIVSLLYLYSVRSDKASFFHEELCHKYGKRRFDRLFQYQRQG